MNRPLPIGYHTPAEKIEQDGLLDLFEYIGSDKTGHWSYRGTFMVNAGEAPLEAYVRQYGWKNPDGSMNDLMPCFIILEKDRENHLARAVALRETIEQHKDHPHYVRILVDAYNWATDPSRQMTDEEHTTCRELAFQCREKLNGLLGWKETEDGKLVVTDRY